MHDSVNAALAVLLTSAGLLGCGGTQSAPESPIETSPQPDPGKESPPSSSDQVSRPELTAEACEASGGAVVGDIGDGAIHRPDYRCPSGAEPSGNIRAPGGGPLGVEGSVCCPR